MTALIHRFRTDESGATAIEYSLVASLVSIVILGAVTALRTSVLDLYAVLADAVAAVL